MWQARSVPGAPPVPPASEDLLRVAVDIAREAGDLTLRWFRAPGLEIDSKHDGSPVTAADRAAEQRVRERIDVVAPGSTVIGEEYGTSNGTTELTWYVDPLDGTKGFARGVPLYATLIAIDDAYGPAIGVIHIPATGETVWAGRGLGCFTDAGRGARVSDTPELKRAYVCTSSVSRWGTPIFDRVTAAGAEVRGWGDGYGFLMVATGRVDAMVDLNGSGNSPWDFAPMRVILPEAGGVFSSLDGTSKIDTPAGIASNGAIHRELLDAVNGRHEAGNGAGLIGSA